MASLSNFQEQFAGQVLEKLINDPVYPAITNRNYEGEIKKGGDRVNILSFLNDIAQGDYVVGTDMSLETVYDTEDQLVVEKRRYWNFPMDDIEKQFTYGNDVTGVLSGNAAKVAARDIDTYVLNKAGDAKAGSWVGVNIRIAGSATTGGTMASIVTTSTGGTLTVQIGQNTQLGGTPVEQGDGTLAFSGFTTADIGKGVRLTSGTTWATPYYLITAVTDTNTATITNWDGNTQGSDIPNGDILYQLYGDYQFSQAQNGDGKPTTQQGWGWEFQAGFATSLTDSNVYEAIVATKQILDANEVPDSDRHLTGPEQLPAVLLKASRLTPAVQMAYEGVVINGRVGRVAAFDIHVAAGSRMSQRAGHPTTVGVDTDAVNTNSSNGYLILANHPSYVTFASAFTESRVVDQILQFAKNYQGLMLYGAKVPALRRKMAAVLFGAF